MKKSKKFLKNSMMIFVGSVLISNTITPTAEAMTAHEEECSIWLCLPVGFGAMGCAPALSRAMKKIRKGKNPLPSWGSCSSGREVQPYTLQHKYKIYKNYGKGAQETEYQRRGIFGRLSDQGCPSSGVYTKVTTHRYAWATIKEEWAIGVCTGVELYGTTLNDMNWTYGTWGKPLGYTQSNQFKPYLIRKWTVRQSK